MMKYAGTELNKARHELVMAAGGSERARMGERPLEARARPAREWLRTKANSIEGGTSEIQLGIIAKRILEPCREPDPMPLYLTDDQAMLRDTARELHGRGRRDREAAPPLARHRLQGRLRPRPVEAVRRAGLQRHPDRRGGWRARPRPCRGGDRARGDRPQPDAVALPDQRGRLRRGAEGHARSASAGIPASSPARRSRRWRSTRVPSTGPRRSRCAPSAPATASA